MRADALFRPSMPFHLVWLATGGCNARCRHCSSASTSRASDELSTEEVFVLLEDLAAAGVVDLAISGGEPLLRPDLVQIVRHARSVGLSVGVGTNGTTITERNAERLAAAGVGRLQVSLDGLPASHDALRCWPGLYTRAERAIAIARDAGLRVHVCCTINRLNHREIELLAARVEQLGVRRLNLSRFVPTGRGGEDLDLDAAEWRASIEHSVGLRDRFRGRLEIVTHLAQQILVDQEVAAMPGFVGCQAGRGQGCITSNGTVLPCVLLPVPLGNVRERSFEEVWRCSSVVRALQARQKLHGACGRCTFKNRCGGCRAVALAKTGDFLATDERCWLANDAAQAC